MDWKVILDLVIAVLLLATIGYAMTLNSRLTQLRRNRDDLARIIVSFNEATVRAESSIPKLKKAAEEAGMSLQERVDKAQSLRDDLAFMIERADSMANRLESAVRQSRNESRIPAAAPVGGGNATGGQTTTPMPSTLLGGGFGAATAAPRPSASSTVAPGNPYVAPATGRGGVGTAGTVAPPSRSITSPASSTDIEDERSQAELELLRALQAMR